MQQESSKLSRTSSSTLDFSCNGFGKLEEICFDFSKPLSSFSFL
jgi:hypothetical protein